MNILVLIKKLDQTPLEREVRNGNAHGDIITFYNDHYSARICDLAPNLMLEELLNSLLTDSLKKQFKCLGFYIKNLNEELLNVFLEFIGKMQEDCH